MMPNKKSSTNNRMTSTMTPGGTNSTSNKTGLMSQKELFKSPRNTTTNRSPGGGDHERNYESSSEKLSSSSDYYINNGPTSSSGGPSSSSKPVVSLDEFMRVRSQRNLDSSDPYAAAAAADVPTRTNSHEHDDEEEGPQQQYSLGVGRSTYNTGTRKQQPQQSHLVSQRKLHKSPFHKSSSKGGLLASPSAATTSSSTMTGTITSASDPLGKSRTSTSTGFTMTSLLSHGDISKSSRDDSAAALSLQSFHNHSAAYSIATNSTSCRTPSLHSKGSTNAGSIGIYGTPGTNTTSISAASTTNTEQLSVYSKQSSVTSNGTSTGSTTLGSRRSVLSRTNSLSLSHHNVVEESLYKSQSNVSSCGYSSSASGMSLTLSHHPADPSAVSASASSSYYDQPTSTLFDANAIEELHRRRSSSHQERLQHYLAKSLSMLLLDDTDDEQDLENENFLLQQQQVEEEDDDDDEEEEDLLLMNHKDHQRNKQEALLNVVDHLEEDHPFQEKTATIKEKDRSKHSHESKSESHLVVKQTTPSSRSAFRKETALENKKINTTPQKNFFTASSALQKKGSSSSPSSEHCQKQSAFVVPTMPSPVIEPSNNKDNESSGSSSSEEIKILPSQELRELRRRAFVDLHKHKFKDSANYTKAMDTIRSKIATLDFNELTLGVILGEGQFGAVSAVNNIQLYDRSLSNESHHQQQQQQQQLRQYVQGRVMRRDSLNSTVAEPQHLFRYAVKVLKNTQCCSRVSFFNATRDMAIEIHLLAAMDHKHILKLRGVSSEVVRNGSSSRSRALHSTPSSSNSTLFFMTDQLHGTLKEKFLDWRLLHKQLRLASSSSSTSKSRSRRQFKYQDDHGEEQHDAPPNSSSNNIPIIKEEKRHLLEVRLRILRDVASAIHYMHNKGIMQRDLKPDNIGFDIKGVVKIFDFGLGSEFPLSSLNNTPNKDSSRYPTSPPNSPLCSTTKGNSPLCSTTKGGKKRDKTELTLYNLTGRTGSLRYMAPENYLHQPYNESIDIYAFSIIIWQTVTLQHLYPNYDKQMIVTQVIKGGQRPDLGGSSSSSSRRTGDNKTSSSTTAASKSTLAITESMKQLLKQMWSNHISMRPSAKYVLKKLNRELALCKEAKQLLLEKKQETSTTTTTTTTTPTPGRSMITSTAAQETKKSNNNNNTIDNDLTLISSQHQKRQMSLTSSKLQLQESKTYGRVDTRALLLERSHSTFDLNEAKKRLKEQQLKHEQRLKRCNSSTSGRHQPSATFGDHGGGEQDEDNHHHLHLPSSSDNDYHYLSSKYYNASALATEKEEEEAEATPTVNIDLLYEPEQDLPSSFFGGTIRPAVTSQTGATTTPSDVSDHHRRNDTSLNILKRSNTRTSTKAQQQQQQQQTSAALNKSTNNNNVLSRQDRAHSILEQLEATLDMTQYAEKAKATSNLLAQLEKTLDLGGGSGNVGTTPLLPTLGTANPTKKKTTTSRQTPRNTMSNKAA